MVYIKEIELYSARYHFFHNTRDWKLSNEQLIDVNILRVPYVVVMAKNGVNKYNI